MMCRNSCFLRVTTFLAGCCLAIAQDPTFYYADLGPYGLFEMEISADDGTMTWKSDLKNIDKLERELGVEIPFFNYHLHQQWTLNDADYAIGGDGCGPVVTGGHYDPFFACGPASGIPADICLAIGKERSSDRYRCSADVFAAGEYAECEVGDLSGKDGPITVVSGTAYKESDAVDPLAAINAQFFDRRIPATADRFASILFHNGSPRVLCGKLFKGIPPNDTDFPSYSPSEAPTSSPTDTSVDPPCDIELFLYNADDDKAVEVLKPGTMNYIGCDAHEGGPIHTNVPYKINIEARPNESCSSTTRSVKLDFKVPNSQSMNTRVENQAPFTIYGDANGDIYGDEYAEGEYEITVSLYSEGGANGDLLFSKQYAFWTGCSARRNLRHQ